MENKKEEEKADKKYDEVDFDSAIDDFGEETVQFCVAQFLEKTYNELKTIIPQLYQAQNYKEIRGKMHILKTNSGYMGAANFSALSKEFETACKFESLDVPKINELYPIFMTNLDKLYEKLKIMNKEKFEGGQEEEIEQEKDKEPEESKENNENKENNDNKENNENNANNEKNEKNENNNENNENENKENNEKNEQKETEEKDNNNDNLKNEEKKENVDNNINTNTNENNNEKNGNENAINNNNNENENSENKEEQNQEETKTYKIQVYSEKEGYNENKNYGIAEQPDEDENSNNLIELKNCPKESKKEVTFKEQSSSNKNNNIKLIDKNLEQDFLNFKPSHLFINKEQKIRNLSSSNIHELTGIKDGNIESFRGNPKYKKIIQSFKLTEEESKRKMENKVLLSPKHTVETEKNKVLNRVKLGFSTMDKNEIRDCLKRYDIAVLKNSATLVKENIIKFLNEVFPNIINDFKKYLNECDLSKKKEIIEKVNIIISNMKYLSDNYNIFFFRFNERLEICKDNEKFKLILTKLIQKLHMLEEELTIIYKVKIKRDDSFLKKMGYFQVDITKNSKKNVVMDSIYNYRNKENNNEQIEGLKKNLGINNNGKIKEVKHINSKKKLKHFPYSFKDQKLFTIEDKKQIHSSFKNKLSNKIITSSKNLSSEFEKDIPKYMDKFKEAITNKNKDLLIQVLTDFESEILKKYDFSNMIPIMDKWVSKIKKGDSFEDLNANMEDLEEVINFMKQELSSQNLEIIHNEEDSQENDENVNDEEKNKEEEDNIGKEDMALYSQLKQFNAASFFQPKNQGLSQHKFKLKVEKIIKESMGNNNEIIQNNKNTNYNMVEKISSHIVLSQNFRTKKNKLIGYSYPFKEDTFLNNCNIF